MKPSFWLVVTAFAVLAELACGAAVNQTSLTADQRHFQIIENSLGLENAPCDNFFKYACEGFHTSVRQESIQQLDEDVEKELKKFVKSFQTINRPKFLKEVYNYYQSCEDQEDKFDEPDALEYLRWMHSHDIVAWPMVAANARELPWIELLALTRKYGFNEIFFHEHIIQRPDNSLKLAIELKRPAAINLNEFRTQMSDLEDKLNATDMHKFGQFQEQLLKLTMQLIQSEENSDFSFILNTMSMTSDMEPRLVTLRELQMPWLNQYLSVLLDQGQVNPDMELYVHSVKYLRRINDFVSSHDNRFLCDYIQIRFLKFLTDSLSKKGSCIQSTRYLFPLVMQWTYEKYHLEYQWETQLIKELFNNLKGKFKQTLAANTYEFKTDVFRYLQAKIDNLQLMVGDLSAEDLEHYYQHLTLRPSEFYGNQLQVYKVQFQASHDALSRSLKRNAIEFLRLRTFERDQTLNDKLALYNMPLLYPRLNTIFLPVTMLRQPYYEFGMNDLYAYSSIGFLLSHEIAKAFDQRHLQIDGDGNTNSAMYEAMQRNQKFQQATQRLRRDFEDEQHNIDEVFDDLGGLKLAYDTFADLQPHVLQQTLAIGGSSMTMEKLFFLNYAQNFCSPICGLSTMSYFYYDVCERVNTPLRHFNKFQETFGCSDNHQAQSMWR